MNARALLSVAAVPAVVAAVLVPLSPAQAAPVPTCHGLKATIVGTPAPDHMTATPFDDVIVSLGGDDVVLGRGGNDVICGGDGADTLLGGPGDDRLYGQREAWHSDRGGTYFVPDVLDGGAGDDLLNAGGDARSVDYGAHGVYDFSSSPHGVTVDLAAGTATGRGDDTLVPAWGEDCDYTCHWITVLGSDHDDEIVGTEHGEELIGNGGDDHVVGGAGSDDLVADSVSSGGAAGDDVLEGGPGTDQLGGDAGRDVFRGDDGDDTLWSTGGGPSQLYGGAGDDRLSVRFAAEPGFVADGGEGADDVATEGPRRSGAGGRPTAATLTMGDGLVVADGQTWGRIAGEEIGLYTAMRWTYDGTDAPEIVHSSGIWLRATTYGGDDEVWGTTGRDWIDTGDGVDKIRAGRGQDTCRFGENVRGCELTS